MPGQSGAQRKRSPISGDSVPGLSIFSTSFGWCGLLGRGRHVAGIMIGHFSAEEVRHAMVRRFAPPDASEFSETDWFPELRRRFERYGLGRRELFDDIEIDQVGATKFQSRVVAATRAIPYGSTMSYGELAARTGSPRAARAVGTVMAGNRFPIVVPCHRVVASGGRLGGFSAPRGLCLKEQLLALEAETVEREPRSATTRLPMSRRDRPLSSAKH